MTEQANRYKLVYHYNNGKQRVLTLDFEDGSRRDKFALTEIDALTTSFSNEKELEKALNSLFPGYEKGYFTIEYKSKGTLNSLELVFNDMPFVRQLATENLKKSVVPKSSVSLYVNQFLAEIEKNPELLRFISIRRYTNQYFREALGHYLMLKNSDEYDAPDALWDARTNLIKEFRRYKTIRGLEVGRHNYELVKQGKEIARMPSELTAVEIAKIEYDLTHPKKVQKRTKPKKTDVIDGQLPLFNPDDYTDNTNNRGKTR